MARMTRPPQLTPRDLGDGLVLRQAARKDLRGLIALHEENFADEWGAGVGETLRPLFSQGVPFTLVEDTRASEIVSMMCLFTGGLWWYGGLPISVGGPNLISTRREYRRRGLVRAQFEVIHEWSAAAGHQVQAIVGDPYFYRQFGYDMALDLLTGYRLRESAVPKLRQGEKEPFRVRRATRDDLPFIARTYREGMRRYLVSWAREVASWRVKELRVIESAQGRRIGFLAQGRDEEGWSLTATTCELRPGVSWLAVTPSVLRYLADFGAKRPARARADSPWIGCYVSEAHPIFRAAPESFHRMEPPYAHYVRVVDLPAFLRHVAPVLEGRLAESIAAGHTGELTLSFYSNGVRLVFARGKLKKVEAWEPGEAWDSASASFPSLTFLQCLFGRRSPQELRDAYADCLAPHEGAAVLLDILFPKLPSEQGEGA